MAKLHIPSFKLNDGREIPALGYGTWVGFDAVNDFDPTDIPKMEECLSYAVDVGYRHIDTAHLYRVEPEVGVILNRKIQEGVCRREELFVTTKVWHHFHRPEAVEESVRGSLRRLNMNYVDMLLMHWPMSITQDGVDEKIDFVETWRGFQAVQAKGLAKSIGVSNFNVKQLEKLLASCKVPPAINQVEINLNLGQPELVDFCQSKGIVVVAFAPFGTMVPSRVVPNSPEPKLNNPTMIVIGQKYGKTVTQVALRYLYQRGIVSIPKTVTKSRVVENASIFDFQLDKEDCAALAKFDIGYRSTLPYFWQDYENYPFEKVDLPKMEIPDSLKKWKNGMNLDME